MSAKWTCFLIGLVAGAGVLAYSLRSDGEPLTADALRTARARWEVHGPADYDLDVVVRGRQTAEHHIEVRGARVTRMTTGGAPAPEHVREFWSVGGMLDFLQTELENAERPASSYGVDDPSAVSLVVDFDGANGMPRRFFRHVRQRALDIDWEVVGFARVPR